MGTDRIHSLGEAFKALHAGPDLFVMPNAWDVGSARMLAGMGAMAIATASAGLAGTMGLQDGGVDRKTALAHARLLVDAVDIPVSADLEDCYANDPGGVAETIRMAAETGLAGCSIEDKRHGTAEFYDAEYALERVKAAIAAVRDLGRPFVLTARADGALGGGYDLAEAVRRAKLFANAGADIVFVPGITENQALADLCASVGAPVSHLTGIDQAGASVSDLAALGVRRVSTGPMLYRIAMGAAAHAAAGLLDNCETKPLLVRSGWSAANTAMKAGQRGL